MVSSAVESLRNSGRHFSETQAAPCSRALCRAKKPFCMDTLLRSDSFDVFPAGLRVLVVDDDALCLKVVEHMLRRCNYTGAKDPCT